MVFSEGFAVFVLGPPPVVFPSVVFPPAVFPVLPPVVLPPLELFSSTITVLVLVALFLALSSTVYVNV